MSQLGRAGRLFARSSAAGLKPSPWDGCSVLQPTGQHRSRSDCEGIALQVHTPHHPKAPQQPQATQQAEQKALILVEGLDVKTRWQDHQCTKAQKKKGVGLVDQPHLPTQLRKHQPLNLCLPLCCPSSGWLPVPESNIVHTRVDLSLIHI